MSPQADVRMREILSAFVIRARRVESHSLVSDRHELVRLAKHQFKIELEGTQLFMTQTFPAEEPFESLAARARPMILEKEPTHYAKVLKSLGYFVRQDVELANAVREFKSNWSRTMEPSDSEVRTQIISPGGKISRQTGDREIALAYIYGDVVHHDEERLANVVDFDIDSRFKSAVPLVAQIALHTVGMLNVLRAGVNRGLIALDPELLTRPVVATATVFRNPVRASVAPVGTKVPDTGDELGGDWTELRPDSTFCRACHGVTLPSVGRASCMSCGVSWG